MPSIKYVNIASYFVEPDWNVNKSFNRLIAVKTMKFLL